MKEETPKTEFELWAKFEKELKETKPLNQTQFGKRRYKIGYHRGYWRGFVLGGMVTLALGLLIALFNIG